MEENEGKAAYASVASVYVDLSALDPQEARRISRCECDEGLAGCTAGDLLRELVGRSFDTNVRLAAEKRTVTLKVDLG